MPRQQQKPGHRAIYPISNNIMAHICNFTSGIDAERTQKNYTIRHSDKGRFATTWGAKTKAAKKIDNDAGQSNQ
jgi:hypothetical protein